VPIQSDFEGQIQNFREQLNKMALSETVKKRIDGAAEAMLRPRNSDRMKAFVKKYALGEDVFQAWRELRNLCAHGGRVPYAEIQKVWDQRCKVLHLCYSIVLAFIGYSGSRTNYHMRGYPITTWPT